MNSYERMRAAVRHEEPDRVPCDFSAEKEVIESLYGYFGIDSMPQLLDRLGIDKRIVIPKYIGPELKTFTDGSYEEVVSGGPRSKDIPSPVGGSTKSIVHFPWADVDKIKDLEGRCGWNGKAGWWDYSTISSQIDEIERQGQYWIGTHGDASGLQQLTMWAGDEKFLLMMAMDPDMAIAMIEKHNEYRLEHALRTLEAGGGRIHEIVGGGDYGTQCGLLISKQMFRDVFKSVHLNFYRQIKKNFDVEIFYHSCGSVAELIPDLIEIGVTILDPIQVTAVGMEIESLKRNFGKKLTFHGGIDIQYLMPNGTERQVRNEVRRTISILGKGGGYILSPTHAFQTDTPLANIIAMYEEAQSRKIE